MRKLFLDDCRKAPDYTWDVVRNYDQFVAYIQLHGVPDIISFDHDLGQEESVEKTGYDCAKWLVERGLLPSKGYYVHSMNPVGKDNIDFVMQGGYLREM